MPPAAITAFRPERGLQRRIEGRVALKRRAMIDISLGIHFTTTATFSATLFGKAIK